MSYNSLFGLGSHSEDASLEGWWPLQDNAASTAIDDVSSNNNNGTLQGGDNTSTLSTTGPNNWLTAALDLDGTADHATITAFSAVANLTTNLTFSARIKIPISVANNKRIFSTRNGTTGVEFYLVVSTTTSLFHYANGVTQLGDYGDVPDDTWATVTCSISSGVATTYIDGSSISTDSLAGTPQASTAGTFYIGRNSGGNYLDGPACDVLFFSRPLSAPEVAELAAGPEPINTVAPALSGTELVGETLTATSGTWALDDPFSGGSNGTVTYSYQWTRSDDDSGTNEADISGATSSTYVLTTADAGKYIRCRVRATNDGGFDANADTNTAFSEQIPGVGRYGSIVQPIVRRPVQPILR